MTFLMQYFGFIQDSDIGLKLSLPLPFHMFLGSKLAGLTETSVAEGSRHPIVSSRDKQIFIWPR